MIDNDHGRFHLICDGCGEVHEDGPFETYNGAVHAGKESGWKATLVGDGTTHNKEWVNLCPTCREEVE